MTKLLRRAKLHLDETLATGEVEAVAALSPIGEILWWGAGAVELFGWAPEEALGRSAFEIFVGTDTNVLLSGALAEARQRRGARWVPTLRRKDGRAITIDAELRLAHDGSSITFVAHEASPRETVSTPVEVVVQSHVAEQVLTPLLVAASELVASAAPAKGHAEGV
ncbi:MAG: PAS domain-containing protein [Deltaproteobacteria bacterium]|nr:PAS domain-containing protein [Deltaproteobacteria bacterium]